MKTPIKSTTLVALALAAVLAGSSPASAQSSDEGVFIHLSKGKEDPHRALMALRMAEMMSDTRHVLVYFDIQGVTLVVKDAPDVTFKQFPSSRTQIETLIKRGVTLMACPGCLQAAGKTPGDLLPGVKVADKDVFFSFAKGRILTLDY